MKTSEIREMSIKEIEERIENETNFLFRQHLNHAITPLDNPLKLREARRNVARLNTLLNQKKSELKQGKK